MENVVYDAGYLLGQVLGYFFIAFIVYSASVTGKFSGEALRASFGSQKELPPKTQKDPIPSPATRPKKLTYTVEESRTVLGVSLGILKSYIATGDIRTYKEGDNVVLDADDVLKMSKKPPKRVFPVIDDYKDEHKITNPVEFGD